jgi:demethylmenaquinone methyltransferase/2-methoxy-6-polyprenyl-1,4-benzoquinol methylase
VTSPTAWSEDELASNPHAAPDKARRVRAMFAAIAPSYDLNNRVHSLGRDQAWRRAAVNLAAVRSGETVLDVACGTGDLSLAFARSPAAQVIGVDFTYEMLPIAAGKSRQRAIRYVNGDAMSLPLPDASVDVVSIAFGIRNVAEPARAIAEFHRVLRPGGRVIVLEFSTPTNPLLRAGYLFYFRHVLPRTATLISRDRSGAYRYLPRSVDTFLDRSRLIAMLHGAGFTDVTHHPLTFGVAVAYRGVKPPIT